MLVRTTSAMAKLIGRKIGMASRRSPRAWE